MFNNFLIHPNKSLKTALKLISKNGCKTVLVVQNDVFLGTLSDGDIRKAVPFLLLLMYPEAYCSPTKAPIEQWGICLISSLSTTPGVSSPTCPSSSIIITLSKYAI